MRHQRFYTTLTTLVLCLATTALNTSAEVIVSGELKQWHKITLTADGPHAKETDVKPNPFIDLQFDVRFTHESGSPDYWIPGYFAADGNASETSATEGNKWRAHLSPDKTGTWNYTIRFKGTKLDGTKGKFNILPSDKTGIDLRSKGRLQYVGSRYLRHAGNGEWFLKAGADSPETFLAYKDFDGTVANRPKACPLKSWQAHIQDWKTGDPTWKNGKGKGMIGAINYLASKGCNAFSFIPYNAGGDGDNVWPHISRTDKLHFDCSKLDQWGVVFDHATTQGMYLHFKLQETENDDTKTGSKAGKKNALDRGELGIQRRAYLREMIARFGHNLALNWNIGEENTQSIKQIGDQAKYIRKTDPYDHNIVLHTYPDQQEKVYGKCLGNKEILSGVSLQNSHVAHTHRDALKWITRSKASGHPWVIGFDEAGNANIGTPPDPEWPGVAAKTKQIKQNQSKKKPVHIPSIDDIRAQVLWGTLMAGGAGVEYYFGYQLPENDLKAQNWRSREKTWQYSRIALEFFRQNKIPFWEMHNTNALVGNHNSANNVYCLSKKGQIYLVYLRKDNQQKLDLTHTKGHFSVYWFNPRQGGKFQKGSIQQVNGGGQVDLGSPPSDKNKDWVIIIQSNS